MTAIGPSRPLLRYHGGKWRLAPWIIANLPPHRVYVEPYGGAASVLLQKPHSYAEVYNDLDGEIVNLFRVVRERPGEMTRALLWTPFSREDYRLSFEATEDPLERARRTVIRSLMGFGSNSLNKSVKSGFRSNTYRSGRTPAHDWGHFPPTIRRVAKRLRSVVIENRPALEIIAQHDRPETCFYLDPPYVHDTRSAAMHGAHGYAHEMTNAQHEELHTAVRGLRGMVVLSGYRGALYEGLYADWPSVETDTTADGAKPRVEVLWFNAKAWAARADDAPLFR